MLSTIDPACQTYQILLDQRRRYNYFNAPPSRIELVSPYPEFSVAELNMRRKVEILKYRNNKSNTKTNDLTKKQHYAQLARGMANPYSEYTIASVNYDNRKPYYYGYTLTTPVNGVVLEVGVKVVVNGDGFYTKLINVAGLVYSSTIKFLHNNSHGTIQSAIVSANHDPSYAILYDDGAIDIVNSNCVQIMTLNKCEISSDENQVVPTWSTAADVPGSPVLLNMDPKVPLYNYISSRSADYNEVTTFDTAVFKLYTRNELEFVLKAELDDSNYDDYVNHSYQTRTSTIGSLIITKHAEAMAQTFEINIPVGIWFRGSKGFGLTKEISDTDTNYIQPHVDSSGVYRVFRDDLYTKSPGYFTSSDIMTIQAFSGIVTSNNPGINMNISYSDTPVNLLSSFDTVTNFTDLSFSLYDTSPSYFYGIQYIGNLKISNIQLNIEPYEVYDITVTMSYQYSQAIAEKLDYFKTGVFFNISSANQNVYDGVTIGSNPHTPFIQSSFTQFTPGSIIPLSSPSLTETPFGKAGPGYITISNIIGNFDTVTIIRSGKSKALYTDIKDDKFVDTGLEPISEYYYKITPILNAMNGSTVTIGPYVTTPIYIQGDVDPDSVTLSSITLVNIAGNFTSYDILRNKLYRGYFILDASFTGKTSSTFLDGNLAQNTTYSYSLIPHYLDPFGINSPGTQYDISGSYTTRVISISAEFLELTPKYVSVVITSGNYDKFTFCRGGYPIMIVFDIKETDVDMSGKCNRNDLPGNIRIWRDSIKRLVFTDYTSTVSPGSKLLYYLIPNRYGLDGERVYLSNDTNHMITIPQSFISIAEFGTITYTSIEIPVIKGICTTFNIQRRNILTNETFTFQNIAINKTVSSIGETILDTPFLDIFGLQPYIQYEYTIVPLYYSTYDNSTLTGISYPMKYISVLPPIPPVFTS